jgi:cytochrome c-type biogenesis protein CcmH
MRVGVTHATAAIRSHLQARMGAWMLSGGILILAAVYLWIGSPPEATSIPTGQPTRAVAQQSALTGSGGALSLDTLREQAQRYPRDGRGWALLAYAAVEANAYAEAGAAFEKAVSVSTKVAADPGVLCDWADALGMAQGGTLRGKPTELILRALALRSDYPKALEMAGSAAYEDRQFALAADYWSRLLRQMPQGTPGHLALEEGIARAGRLAAQQPGKS